MRPERRPAQAGADLAEGLRTGADRLGLALDERTRQRLLDYLGLLGKWNAVYNLTAIRDPWQMLVQHLLDALSVVPSLRRRLDLDRATLADVGSGGGLPGLPIALLHPGCRVVSIEPVGKKAAFQRQVCAELGLANVEVLAVRAETVRQPCDAVTCRAFASLADFVAVSSGLCGPDTLRAAMKGQLAALQAERAALPPGWTVEVEPLAVPFLDAERHLVLLHPPGGVSRP